MDQYRLPADLDLHFFQKKVKNFLENVHSMLVRSNTVYLFKYRRNLNHLKGRQLWRTNYKMFSFFSLASNHILSIY